jgi:F-type H+-transporting ATPase subunit epsilon
VATHAGTIELDLVTPTRKLIEGLKVKELTLPGADGEMTILPGHVELLTLLGSGVLSFPTENGRKKYAVSYGFAEVRKNRALILAETAEESKEIDRERAVESLAQAAEELRGSLTADKFNQTIRQRERAQARLKASEKTL